MPHARLCLSEASTNPGHHNLTLHASQTPGLPAQTLKSRHRLERDNHHVNLTLRVHRSLSWLQRAEQADDPDGRFVFLWIAFNAAYATDIDENYRLSEQETFRAFCASFAIWIANGR